MTSSSKDRNPDNTHAHTHQFVGQGSPCPKSSCTLDHNTSSSPTEGELLRPHTGGGRHRRSVCLCLSPSPVLSASSNSPPQLPICRCQFTSPSSLKIPFRAVGMCRRSPQRDRLGGELGDKRHTTAPHTHTHTHSLSLSLSLSLPVVAAAVVGDVAAGWGAEAPD